MYRSLLFSLIILANLAFSTGLTKSQTKKVQSDLRKIGWPLAVDGAYGPITKRTVRRFQQGWTFKKLVADGIAGPNTRGAIKSCLSKSGRASPHFKFSEFKSKGNGDIWVKRKLLSGLEALRKAKGGKPLYIISGYRDPAHNKRVGGAPNSQHMKGTAADFSSSYGASFSFVKGLRKFSGIGRYACNNLVTHVDVRTGSSTSSPAAWTYDC